VDVPVVASRSRPDGESMMALEPRCDTVGVQGSAARRIGIALFSDVEELDAVGPWEVLVYWAPRPAAVKAAVRASRAAGKRCSAGVP